MAEETVRVLIVEGRFYSDLSDELLNGATSTLEAHGVQYDVVSVPGALEIPAVVALADENALYDGYVALGVVIRGETYHFEIVANVSEGDKGGGAARACLDVITLRRQFAEVQ